MTAHPASSRRRLLAGATGLGGAALATAVAAGGQAAANDPKTDPEKATAGKGRTGWLNVKDRAFGALGDDQADDQPAIQRAIDMAGQGGTVYFPPGRYRLASPLRLSRGVTLRGDWNPHFPMRTNMADSYLRPGIGNFTGEALIVVDPVPPQGDYQNSAFRGGPRLYGLALDGRDQKDSTGAAVDGIRINPGVRDVGMDKVTVWRFSGHGVNAQNSAAFQLNQVHAIHNGGHGFTWGDARGNGGGLVDADLFQCYSQGNKGHGYDILNPNAVTLVDCRSEWNSQHGYHITGRVYSLVLVGCNTDRSGGNGFHVATSAGGRFAHFVGCLAKRDGKNGPGHAGFRVTGNWAAGVVLTGCSTSVARDDDNAGTYSPSYGLSTTALDSSHFVSVTGGQYVGTEAAFDDAGKVVVRHSGVAAGVQTSGTPVFDRSDVHVVSGGVNTYRDVEFATRGRNRRWALRATSASESGANNGSDFALVRYADNGTELDHPLRVNRANGRIFLGQENSTPAVEVNVNSNPGFRLASSRTQGGQGYAFVGADTTARAFQSQIPGDAISRYVIEVDGAQSWGPGGTTVRDTSWGRLGPAAVGSPNADIVAAKAGRGLKVKEGADAKMGTLTLTGATPVTVPTTAVTAASRIFLTVQEPGGTPSGIAYVSGRVPGESFSVRGTAGDASTVAWLIVEPA
ncbi:hypothetical protein DIZ27_44810 [Streptomyces sp. NWU339]|uniref:right-handed parallel beta-helix repeat-containing protein n=1 Tax=Streptomyces sp. NWU339 TaxID=2185284 RepID=UPI000D684796|nr:right-handed parallel beta-helix repeat-containing protein [Streptomyces sp. NWU339]PWI04529.1 hypothetical protein DIZ27_44810 [Streptomyces sp. NWU339]